MPRSPQFLFALFHRNYCFLLLLFAFCIRLIRFNFYATRPYPCTVPQHTILAQNTPRARWVCVCVRCAAHPNAKARKCFSSIGLRHWIFSGFLCKTTNNLWFRFSLFFSSFSPILFTSSFVRCLFIFVIFMCVVDVPCAWPRFVLDSWRGGSIFGAEMLRLFFLRYFSAAVSSSFTCVLCTHCVNFVVRAWARRQADGWAGEWVFSWAFTTAIWCLFFLFFFSYSSALHVFLPILFDYTHSWSCKLLIRINQACIIAYEHISICVEAAAAVVVFAMNIKSVNMFFPFGSFFFIYMRLFIAHRQPQTTVRVWLALRTPRRKREISIFLY